MWNPALRTLVEDYPLSFLCYHSSLALPLGHGKGRFSPGRHFLRDQGDLVTRKGLSMPPLPGLSPAGLLHFFSPRMSPIEVFVPKQYFQGNLHSGGGWVVRRGEALISCDPQPLWIFVT